MLFILIYYFKIKMYKKHKGIIHLMLRTFHLFLKFTFLFIIVNTYIFAGDALLSECFPGVDIPRLKKIVSLEQSQRHPIPADNNLQFLGEDSTNLTSLDIFLFRDISNKDVLEIGAGSGIQSGRLLLTDLRSLETIEISRSAFKKSDGPLTRYKNLCPAEKNYSANKRLVNRCENFLTCELGKRSYDVITIREVFHLISPEDALRMLKKAKTYLNADSQLYITAGMPSMRVSDQERQIASWNPFLPANFVHQADMYRRKISEGTKYPGYYDLEDVSHKLFATDLETMQEMLNEAGFDVIEIYTHKADGEVVENPTYEIRESDPDLQNAMMLYVIAQPRAC